MYHAIIRRRVKATFNALNRSDYAPALSGMADSFDHYFAGEHCLGGVRNNRGSMKAWFKRLFRLNKNLDFDLKHIAVSGTPWNTTVTVEWTDGATLANGLPYFNRGVHVVRMKWGKVTSLHAYLDTAVWIDACRSMQNDGIAEAAAAKITDVHCG
jgi:ketosteroid isomerase-like protein